MMNIISKRSNRLEMGCASLRVTAFAPLGDMSTIVFAVDAI